jgi:hypothetical protein
MKPSFGLECLISVRTKGISRVLLQLTSLRTVVGSRLSLAGNMFASTERYYVCVDLTL